MCVRVCVFQAPSGDADDTGKAKSAAAVEEATARPSGGLPWSLALLLAVLMFIVGRFLSTVKF